MSTTFRAAFRQSVPIMFGFVFLGLTYGIYMHQLGFSLWYPTIMALVIYGGSVEFVVAAALTQPFNPLNVFFLALIINSRHLFYGISILHKYQAAPKWRRFYLIFGMCDETFTLNYATTPPAGANPTNYMVFITLLNQIYWVTGAFLGGALGTLIKLNLNGLDFVMTALFITLFMGQLVQESDHFSSSLGVVLAVVALLLLGKTYFLPAAMLMTLIILVVKQHFSSSKVREES